MGAALICGATVVLTRKFSASNFFKDAIKYKCTGFSFVGEVCRYLLNQPPSELDRTHSLRACIGNGMRGTIHQQMWDRFGIKGVELYGATEGNCVLVNMDGKFGACGYLPVLNDVFPILPYAIIKIDQDMNPIRDSNGFCIRCAPNEKGLMIGILGKSINEQFNGYANQNEQSQKKVIENVFKNGQRAFNSGDILMRDEFGYVYFVDRLGDTFRWRGENVSTNECENIISARIDSKEVIVYGVTVPGQEGRAGMATIMDNNLDVKKLGEFIKQDLPPYAKPLFIRLDENVEHTG
jgi:solute carrier family 27 fatty acid transporter 1/4